MSNEFVYEDGRKAEKIEMDQGKTKITEIYVEPRPEKKLAQRITEKYCVCERLIETLDETTGEVVNSVVERVSNGDVVSTSALENSKTPEVLVEEKLKNKSKYSLMNVALIGIVAVQVLGLVYLLFAK